MSRDYRIWVLIFAENRKDAVAVEEAVTDLWPIRRSSITPTLTGGGKYAVHLVGDGTLVAGRMLEDLARDIQRGAWRAAGAYVEVQVSSVSLNPCDAMTSRREDFERDRSAGALDGTCIDCDAGVPFGSGACQCEDCRNWAEREGHGDG